MARPVRFRGKWRIRWFDEYDKRQSAVYEDYNEARSKLKKLEGDAEKAREEIEAGIRAKEPPKEHTFAELITYWLEHRVVARRKRRVDADRSMIRCHLAPVFGALAIRAITPQKIDAFVAERGHLSKKTIYNILTLLISMLNAAVEIEWIAKAPRVRKPRVSLVDSDFRYLRTEDDVRRFLRSAREEGEASFALFATAVYTGARAGELAGLRWPDVSFDRRLITIQRSFSGPTKSDRIRHVPILDPLLPILREWRLKCPGEIVFPNGLGEMHKHAGRIFQEVFRRVLKRAGLEGACTFHGLRHSFASHWMMRSGDLFRLQKILGHSCVQMTMRYAHLAPDAFSADYGRLSSLGVAEEAPVAVLKQVH
jgi:integrase